MAFTYYFDAIYNVRRAFLNPVYSDSITIRMDYQDFDFDNIIDYQWPFGIVLEAGSLIDGIVRIELSYTFLDERRLLIIDRAEDIATIKRFQRMIGEAGGLR